MELVESVGDLFQAGVNIGEGQGGEKAEAGGVGLDDPGPVFVAFAGEAVCLRFIAQIETGVGDGEDGGSGVATVEVFQ